MSLATREFWEHDARYTHDVCPSWTQTRDRFKGRTVCHSGWVKLTDLQGFGASVVSSAKVQCRVAHNVCSYSYPVPPLLYADLWASNRMRFLVYGYSWTHACAVVQDYDSRSFFFYTLHGAFCVVPVLTLFTLLVSCLLNSFCLNYNFKNAKNALGLFRIEIRNHSSVISIQLVLCSFRILVIRNASAL